MDVKTRFIAVLCAVILASSGLTACAREAADPNASGTQDITNSAPSITVSEPTDNPQPKYTITQADEATTQSTRGSSSSEPGKNTEAPATLDEPVSSHPITEASVETNSAQEIIDDYKSDLVFNTENSDELYEMFGLNRSQRQAYYAQISNTCNFPIIHISTENKKEVLSLDNYVNCLVEIMNCEDEYVMDAVSGGIRVRGNASAHYGKVDELRKNGAPYRIKFTHKQSVLGLNDNARCKSWVLLKTYDTGVRDQLAFELAKAINAGKYYSSDSRFVQVYVNEEYKGIYLLCEQSQANSNRVAITECEEGYTGTDIGYFVELDNYSSGETYKFMLNYNKESITDVYGTKRTPRTYYYSVKNDLYSKDQLKFIERYFEVCYEIPMRAIKYGEFYRLNDDFSLTLAQNEFSNAVECVSQVLDIESFVDMYITYEIVNDQDVGGGSFYFAVDFSGNSTYKTLTCVCPWDFSWAYTDYNAKADGGLYAAKFKDSYFVDNWGDRSNPWLILLYSADWFQELVKEKWQERYPAILKTLEDENKLISDYTSDFNKDGKSRASRAKTTVGWVESRVKYLNGLWG